MLKKFWAVLLAAALAFCSACSFTGSIAADIDKNNIDLTRYQNDRNAFETKLIVEGPSPQYHEEEAPPEGVSEVIYPSGDLELKAWLSDDPGDGQRHPAVVYAHGGFAFGLSDWEDAQAFTDAGFVLMTPMVRGENGNLGNYEGFFGEVDDVIAAGDYLKELPYVDPENIFLCGHSVGGTLSMLTSMLPSSYKAIATFGASPNQRVFFKSSSDIAPFDYNDFSETDIRSPLAYIDCIQKPLYIFVAEGDLAYVQFSRLLADSAKEMSKDCEMIVMEGDHFTSLQPSIEQSIERFSDLF